MPDPGWALCTLDQVKAHLGITKTDKDSFLQNAIDAASMAIQSYCGRQFRERTYTDERHDGDGKSAVLYVRHYPIVSVASLYDDPGRDFGTSTLIDPDNYEVYADEGLIARTDRAFLKGTRSIKVTYNAGYAAVPDDLRQGCAMLAAEYYLQAPGQKGHQGVKTQRLAAGGGDVTFVHGEMPEEVVGLIRPYRRLGVG